jgi:ActR/RegA family two-component response regulator
MAEGIKEAVLIVDDQPNWRKLLSELLEDAYEVTSVGKYAEALDALLAQDPPFHVAVVDIRLDDKDRANEDGLRLIAELNSMGRCTTTIVVTGYPTLRTVKKALQDLGAFEYLEKYPEDGNAFDHVSFREKVREAVDDAEKQRQEPFVFVLMPFAPEYKDVYEDVVKKVIENEGLACIRADDLFKPHRIMNDIRRCIREAKFIAADLSGKNPNVFYEVGMAHAVGQTVLLLTQSMDDVPPKLRDVRCIMYEDTLEGAKRLGVAITDAIRSLQGSTYRVEPIFERKSGEIDSKLCFALVPSTDPGRRAYEQIVEKVVAEFGLTCVSSRSVFSTEHIMDEIWEHLNRASVIIADLSGKDPDVFYLTGMSHGLGKRVVLLARSKEDVPFDLRGPSHILCSDRTYREGKEARGKLAKVLHRLLSEIPS